MRIIFVYIFLEIGFGVEVDIEIILDLVLKLIFGVVQKLKNIRLLFIIFDFEIIGFNKLLLRMFKFIL